MKRFSMFKVGIGNLHDAVLLLRQECFVKMLS